MKYDKEVIGKAIRSERERLRLTQPELGEKIGVVGKQISNYEKGILIPPIDVLFKLCEVFHCELGFLLGEEDYSQGSKIETIIHNTTGLSIKAMNMIQKVTGSDRTCIEFGHEPQKYRNILDKLLSSNRFLDLMSSLGDLDYRYSLFHQAMEQLSDQLGDSLLNEAIDCYQGPIDYVNDPNAEPLRPELRKAIMMLDAAIDKQHDLSYDIKVARYELRETFESLIQEVYPEKQI